MKLHIYKGKLSDGKLFTGEVVEEHWIEVDDNSTVEELFEKVNSTMKDFKEEDMKWLVEMKKYITLHEVVDQNNREYHGIEIQK